MKHGKSSSGAYAAGKWFDRLPLRVQDRIREASFGRFIDTLPQDRVEELDVDVVARAYLFYLLSTTLFTNHGNDADLALLFGIVSTRSSLCRVYMALILTLMRGLSLEVEHGDSAGDMLILLGGISISVIAEQLDLGSDIEVPMGAVIAYPDFVQVAIRYQHRRLLLPVAQRGSTATDHLAAFVPDAYAIFVRTQLLVHIPPPSEFGPFADADDLDRSQGSGCDYRYWQVGAWPRCLFLLYFGSYRADNKGHARDPSMSPYRMSPSGCTHQGSPTTRYLELAWCLQLVEARGFNMANVLVMKLDVSQSSRDQGVWQRLLGGDGFKHVLSRLP
ncbi:hypothetical protein JCGZ_07874 [Jatropha curcas]|uniref:Aminotransferase-like plant mobile domain-containing protein n=1 Tax=Jatropha curcas TaxID=180498 RepID=A0A067KK86_JATCU|nr:hypothetical protein JCGZ_07874 [Jatropha curcas]